MPGKQPDGRVCQKTDHFPRTAGRSGVAEVNCFAAWLKLYQWKLLETCERSLAKQADRDKELGRNET